MISKFVTFLSFVFLTITLNLSSQRLDAKYSFDVEVTHTSTRQIIRFADSKAVSLLTVPDDYQFNLYSSGQSCLETCLIIISFLSPPNHTKRISFSTILITTATISPLLKN